MNLPKLSIAAIVATGVLSLLIGLGYALDVRLDKIPTAPAAWSLALGLALLALARSSYRGSPAAFMLALGLSTLEFCRGTFAALQADAYTIEVIRGALVLMILPGILSVREMESARRRIRDGSPIPSGEPDPLEPPQVGLTSGTSEAESPAEHAAGRPAVRRARRTKLRAVIAVLGIFAVGLMVLLGLVMANCDDQSQRRLQFDCVFDGPLPAPTEWVPYAGGHLGFAFAHPSDWTVYESPDFISVTRNDRVAEISFGWFPRLAGETNAEFMERFAATTAANYSEVQLVSRAHPGGDPLEVVMTGLDAEGTPWIIDLVVSGEGQRVFGVQSLAQEDVLEEAQPVFDRVIQSVEIIEE